MLTTLKNCDRWLFTKINHDWTTPFLDTLFPFWREAMTWIPLYFFLLLFVLVNFGRKAWPWIILLIITVGLTDQISSHVLKPLVDRPRPCHDPLLANSIRLLLNYCSDSRSFTSSHAANHFGVGCFIFYTMKPYFKKWNYLFFVWAATVSYGQIYIGVHYPVDVIGGALLGTVIGYFMATAFNTKFGFTSSFTSATTAKLLV